MAEASLFFPEASGRAAGEAPANYFERRIQRTREAAVHMKDKRKHPRTPKKLKSEVHSPEGFTFSTSADLSSGGIFISTPEPVRKGSSVELRIYIPGEEPLTLSGVVRWTRDTDNDAHRTGMGIEFKRLGEREVQALKRIE
jgi:uncharacterized protein (TIGR02266 family)